MKKVVFEEQDNVQAKKLTNDSFVGIVCAKQKSIVMHNSLGFFGIAKYELNLNNRWYRESLLNYVLAFGNPKEVFVFDTKEELFNWFYKD